jgi:hypothetical protein
MAKTNGNLPKQSCNSSENSRFTMDVPSTIGRRRSGKIERARIVKIGRFILDKLIGRI